MRLPNTVTVDIETAPHLCYCWGYYEQNVIKVVEYSYILMVGLKRLGEKTRVYTLLSHPGRNKKDDSKLMKAIRDELDWAEIVIGQNSDQFDIKKLNTAFLKHGLTPPSPFKSVDTKKTSKKHFSFANNKLDNLGEELGFGGKMHHEGFPLWERVMEGDPRAVKKMADYCKRDVELTEKVYLKQRPWMSNHPNVNAFTEKENCRVCQSEKVQFRGFNVNVTGKVRRFQCMDCGAWSQDTKTIRTTTRK